MFQILNFLPSEFVKREVAIRLKEVGRMDKALMQSGFERFRRQKQSGITNQEEWTRHLYREV
jgi:hypothetical protein